MSDDIVVLKNISKSYGGIHALHDVSLSIREGEIHALVGENGAGKSTLIKVLTGAIHRDSGEIYVAGEPQTLDNPIQSRQLGISVIYQEVNLFPELPVMYNLFFSQEPVRGRVGWLEKKKIREMAGDLLSQFNVGIDPMAPLSKLGLGQKRIIEILKAISLDARFLIMDEATTGMSRSEIATLFDIVRELRKNHVTVLYISHHLEEVFELADRVTVLRDGSLIDTVEIGSTSVDELSRAIAGREVEEVRMSGDVSDDAEIALDVADLMVTKLQEPVSFKVRKGEILGLTGVIGSGKTEIARALFGADRMLSGSVSVFGEQQKSLTPQKAKNLGIALVPEERKTQGTFPLLSIANNVIMVNIKRALSGRIFISPRKRQDVSDEAIKSCQIVPKNASAVVRELSGGNQQKVVIAKWLAARPKIIILDEPTRGIDVGAKAEIRKLIVELAEQGVSILYLTSEFKEVLGICNRVIVLKKGAVAGTLDRQDAKLDRIVALALG